MWTRFAPASSKQNFARILSVSIILILAIGWFKTMPVAAGTGVNNFPVVNSADDAGPDPTAGCSYAINANEIYFGECAAGSPITSGFRFPNITLARGAKIAQAYLEVTVDGPYTDELTLALYGEATGNAQPFSLTSEPVNRTVTTQSAPWTIPATDRWELGQPRQSPPLTAIVQAILNRSDWSSGNALAILVKNAAPATGPNRHRRVIAYDRQLGAASYPRLVILIDTPISGLKATNNSPTQLGQATNFTATVSAGTNVNYQWSFGDGQSGSGATVMHTYTAVGSYTTSVTATNSRGSVTAKTTVTLTDVPLNGLKATNNSPTQFGKLTTFTATVDTGTNVTYQWNFGDGQQGSGATPTHAYAAPGVYTATVTAANSRGSATAQTTALNSGCQGNYCLFAVTSSTDDAGPNPVSSCAYAVNWNELYFGECPNGSPLTSGLRFPNITLPPGAKIAQAYLEFMVDGPYTDQLALALYGEATGNAQPFSATNMPANRPVTVLSVPWSTAATDRWEFGQTRQSPPVTTLIQTILNRADWATGNALALLVKNTAPALGVYRHRRVIAYDRQLGAASYPKLVILIDTPISGLKAVTTSPTQLGQATAFTATISAGTNVAYQWSFGDGQSGSGATVTHTYAKLGQYTAIITATNSQGSVTAKSTVTITDVPISGLQASNSSPTQLGQATTFTATLSTGTNVTYQWTFSDDQKGSVAQVTHTYAKVGQYTAKVTATNSLGSATAKTIVTISDAPVNGLQATNSSPTQLGNGTTFTATIKGGSNVTYQWTFGDGQGAAGATATHTYGTVGVYTATVTATNGQGSATAKTAVKITDAPISGLHATNSSPTSLGTVTNFNATISAGTNVTYLWNFGDGQSGNGTAVAHTYVKAGQYTVSVTATNSVGSVTTTTPVTVDVLLTGLHVVSSSPTALGNATVFTATLSGGTDVTYSWNFGDDKKGSGATVTHAYAKVGHYTAVVTARNSLGSVTASTQVTVDAPVGELQVSSSSPTQVGQATTFTATLNGGTNVTYQWNFGDGQQGSGALVQHTYATVGAYTAVVTATNSLGKRTAATTVTVTDIPISGLRATNSSPTTLGDATRFTATLSVGGNVTYQWNFGDGQSGNGATVVHTYAVVGNYTATVTATNSQGSARVTTAVIVNDVIVNGLSVLSSGPTPLGNTTVFTATLSGGTNVTCVWDFGDGQRATGATVTHTYTTVGAYTVVMTATNSLGKAVTTLLITITDAPVSGLRATSTSPTRLGQATTFTATIGGGSNVVYHWNFGDGQSGSGAGVQHTYAAIGEYNATVTAANSLGQVTASTPVLITAVQPAVVVYLPVVRR